MPEDKKQAIPDTADVSASDTAVGSTVQKSKSKISGAKLTIYGLILLVVVFIGVFSSFLPFYEITTVLQLKTGMYELHYVYFGFIGGKTDEKESVFKQLTDGSIDKSILMSSEKHFIFGKPEIEMQTLGHYVSQLEGLWVYEDYDYKPQMLKVKDTIMKAFASGNEITINKISSTFTQEALGHQFNND